MSSEKLVIELQTKLGNSQSEIKSINNSIDGLDASVTSTSKSFDTMSASSRESVESIKKLNNESSRLEKQIGELNSKLIDSRAATKKSSEEMKAYEAQLKKATESGDKTAEEIAEIAKNLDKSRKKFAENSKETNKLNTELKQTKGDLSSVKAELKATASDMGKLEKETKKTKVSVKDLSSAIKKAFAAGSAAAVALVGFVTLTAKSRKELQLLADQAKITAGEFEPLAFAAKMYGVEAEQVAKISNDLQVRLGRFGTKGEGAFKDVTEVLGLANEEAQKYAQTLMGFTAPEAIQIIVNDLEAVGATSEQTTAALNTISGGLEKLNPLFKDNGVELATLTARYNEVNGSIGLLASQEKDLAKLADTNEMLWEQLGNAGTLISASLAPAVNDFFNGVISIVPDATNAIYDFIDSFKDLENRDSIRALDADIATLEGQIDALQEVIDNRISANKKKYGDVSIWDALNPWSSDTGDTTQMQGQLDELNSQLQEFYDRRNDIINAEEEAKQARTFDTVDFNENSMNAKDIASYDREIEALQDRFKTEEELLREKLERDLELIGEDQMMRLNLEAEFQNALLDLQISREDAEIDSIDRRRDAEKRARDETLREEKRAYKQRIGITQDWANAALTAGGIIFEDNKAIRAGMVVVDTAAAAMRAYSDLGPIAGSAAAAAIIATGAAQLASINSATKGGGSVSGGNGVGDTSPSAGMEYQPEDNNEQFVTNSDISGQNTMNVVISFDESTELGVAFNNSIQQAVLNGDIQQ